MVYLRTTKKMHFCMSKLWLLEDFEFHQFDAEMDRRRDWWTIELFRVRSWEMSNLNFSCKKEIWNFWKILKKNSTGLGETPRVWNWIFFFFVKSIFSEKMIFFFSFYSCARKSKKKKSKKSQIVLVRCKHRLEYEDKYQITNVLLFTSSSSFLLFRNSQFKIFYGRFSKITHRISLAKS